MNKLSIKSNSKFVLLILEEFHDDRKNDYYSFLKSKNISYIKCPNELKNPKHTVFKVMDILMNYLIAQISVCVNQKLKLDK